MVQAIHWDKFFTVNNDINIACEKITEILVSIARDKPGMTPAIRKLLRQCKRLHKKATRTGRADHSEQFRDKRREAKASFRLSRINVYNIAVNKSTDVITSSKTYWKSIKLVYGCK